ncbi:MAG: vitamin K epoxide reductase family protein [Chloroflexi bacterium]|nr:vitamin K epoxide reductase family protein [Chloroflexota bacterium]
MRPLKQMKPRSVLALAALLLLTSVPARAEAILAPYAQDPRPGWLQAFMLDPLANSVAVILLVAMIITVIVVLFSFLRDAEFEEQFHEARKVIPVLAVVGMGIAVYMTIIEITRSEAICGPVGDCNSVQQSPYAYLFGVFPVGLFGLLGYFAILGTWLVQRYGPQSLRRFAALAVWGQALFGVLFSIYLTFLEPFVIGATCIWCISSAVVITLLLWFSTPAARAATHQPLDDETLEEITA